MCEAVYFSSLYVARPCGEPVALPPRVASLLPGEGRRQLLSGLPRPGTRSCVVCNVTGTLCFDGDVGAGLVPGLAAGAVQALPAPWNALSINTIFGNLNFRERSSEAMFLGVRKAQHLLALSRLVFSGGLLGVTLHRFDIDTSLGRHVQVAHGCFMEFVGAALFHGLIEPAPRTEEIANVVLLQFPDVGRLLSDAAAEGLVPPVPDEIKNALWENVRGAAQITRVGHVKLRLNWPSPPTIDPVELEHTQLAVLLVCDHLVHVLHAIS